MICHLQEIEVMLIAVFLHLIMKNFIGHENISPKLSSGSFVALWHVEDFIGGGFKVRAPHSRRIDGHGHFNDDFVFVDSSTRLPGIFTKVGEEWKAEVLNGQTCHGVGGCKR